VDSKKTINKMVENILDNFTFQGASSAGLMIFRLVKNICGLILEPEACQAYDIARF